MKEFTELDIRSFSPGEWYFECSMISACRPVFDKCEDNYDVTVVLRKAGVIRPNTTDDTESCATLVLFKSRKAANAFIGRLNAFLKAAEQRINTAHPRPDRQPAPSPNCA